MFRTVSRLLAGVGVVTAAAAAAGCAGADGQASAPIETPSPSVVHATPQQTVNSGPAPGGTHRREQFRNRAAIRVAITDGQVRPPTRRIAVGQGQRVRVTVTGDEATRIHIHGYNLEKSASPGNPAVFEFTADIPGVFEAESHHPTLVLLQLQVR